MRRAGAGPATVRFDPLRASAGLGALAGLLSLAAPFFDGLAAALAGIALGAWLTRAPAAGAAPTRGRRALAGLSLAACLAAWVVFVLAPSPLGTFRGLLLGGAGVGLWFTGRRPSAFGGG